MDPALNAALAQLPGSLVPVLAQWSAQHSLARLPAELLEQLSQAGGMDKQQVALALLPLAASFAYAPLSHFQVGAIAWGGSGTCYLGANLEFPQQALGATIHAEQSAINHAWLYGETHLLGMSINASPCGHCRQFMNELSSSQGFSIYLPTGHYSLQQLLPKAFGPTDLHIGETLLTPQLHPLPAAGEDELLALARHAATLSYAPYSQSYAGVALTSRDGDYFVGRYAENAAFNPSLPPLQSALIMLRMAGHSPEKMQRAALVEAKAGLISHRPSTEMLLAAYGIDELSYLAL
ncbi:MAG: cytidine deaminase [Aeromonadaceae bacterium]